MPQVLCIDAGTTGVTSLLLDARAQVVGRSYREFQQHYPRPGWVEHDAQDILDAATATAAEALREAQASPRDVVIGITNQRETTVLWDRSTGRPLHRAIVWQDRRTARRCSGLAEEAAAIRAKTGLVTDPYFSATKLEWLLQNVEGAGPRARGGELAFGTIDTWLAWQLTGRHVTDDTNASRTMLYDIHRGRWDPDLLALFGVPEEVLPEVVPSSGMVGEVRGGKLQGASLAALVGDQQAALFGQGCRQAGQTKNTYGTGCFLLQHTGSDAVASVHGLLTTRAASTAQQAQYALEGSVFVGGAAVQWLRDGLKIIESSPDVNERAAESDDSQGVVVVPAFAGLGAPHWDPQARGAILGLSRGSSRRHVARATLEAIAHQCHDVIEAMEQETGLRLDDLRVDGGASRSDILMQAQADLIQRPVVRAAQVESTALGAGMLAGLAVDVPMEPDGAGLARFEPAMGREEAAGRVRRWRAAVAAVRAFAADGWTEGRPDAA